MAVLRIALLIAAATLVACRGGGGDNGATDAANQTPDAATAAALSTDIASGEATLAAQDAQETVVAATDIAAGRTPRPPRTGASDTDPTATDPRARVTVVVPTAAPPQPPGVPATVTLDVNPDTPAIEHTDVNAAVGSTFRVAVVVNRPPAPYAGYEYGIHFDAPILSFVNAQQLKVEGLDICTSVPLENTPSGMYGGCLRTSGETSFQGIVEIITLKCDNAGRTPLRMITLAESGGFGTALLHEGGVEFASEVDEGVHVICGSG